MTDFIYLDNPRRKRRKVARRRKRRFSAAQRRAQKKFAAMARARAHARRNPRKTRRRRVRLGKKRFLMIPLKKKQSTSTFKRNSVMSHRRNFRRNPVGPGLRRAGSSFTSNAKSAAIMAVGLVVNGYLSPMVQSLVPISLGSFQPALNAAVPLAVATFVKSPAVKLVAQAAAAVELAKLVSGGVSNIAPLGIVKQPPRLPSGEMLAGLGDGGSFSTVPYPLAE